MVSKFPGAEWHNVKNSIHSNKSEGYHVLVITKDYNNMSNTFD